MILLNGILMKKIDVSFVEEKYISLVKDGNVEVDKNFKLENPIFFEGMYIIQR